MKTISGRGLTSKDQLVLKSLIDLVITRTSYSWSYTDDESSDVAIIDTDNLSDPESIIGDLQRQKILAVEYSQSKSTKGQFYLPKPLRAATLIAAINSVEAVLDPSEQKPSHTDDGIDALESYLLENTPDITSSVTSVLSNFTGSLAITSGNQRCLIDLAGDRYQISNGISLDELLKRPDKRVTPVNKNPDTSTPTNWQTSPSLRWKLGIHLSEGALVNSLHSSSRFKLLRWPPSDVPRSASPYILNLCALLGRKSGATLEEIIAESKIPKADAVGFINGAYLARAISVRAFNSGDQAPTKGSPSAPANQSLFAKIRDRLTRKPK